MKAFDERLHYFVTLAHLLSEAEAQLEADAEDPGSAGYAEQLDLLRDAVEAALDAAIQIGAHVQAARAHAIRAQAAEGKQAAKH